MEFKKGQDKQIGRNNTDGEKSKVSEMVSFQDALDQLYARIPLVDSMIVNKCRLDLQPSEEFFFLIRVYSIIYGEVDERLVGGNVAAVPK